MKDEIGHPTYFKGLDVKSAQPLILGILLIEKYEKESELSSEDFSETFPEDVLHYISLCEKGKLYPFLIALFLSKNIEFDEEVFKVQLFSRIFYNKERDNYTFKMRAAFQEVFPTVSQFITEVKEEEQDHSRLPIRLQLKESQIMYKVWVRLLKMNIPFFPVHDCVYVPDEKSTMDVVRSTMIEEFKSFGVTPTIHID